MGEVGNLLLQASYLVCANSLRREAKLCDIILYVQGRMGAMVGYPAHKLLLISASKYFKLLFEREELRSYCHFPHLQEEGVFAVLDIIYGREIRSETNIDDALMAARFLQVDCAVEQLEKKRDSLKASASPPAKRRRTPSGSGSQSRGGSQADSPAHRPADVRVFKNVISKEEEDMGESETSNQGYHEQDDQDTDQGSTYHDHGTGQDGGGDNMVSIKMEPDVDLTMEEEEHALGHGAYSYPGQAYGQGGDSSSGLYSADMSNNPSTSFHDPSFGTGLLSATNLDNGQGIKFQCDICGKEFATAEFLEEHRATHTGCRKRGGPTIHQCDTCGKVFSKKSRLTRHALIHTGEKPFKCPVCNRGFNQLSNQIVHTRTHDLKVMYCDVCLKVFKNEQSLHKHKASHVALTLS